MKDCTNYPCYHVDYQCFKMPDGVKAKFDFDFSFQSLFAPLRLNCIMAVIVML